MTTTPQFAQHWLRWSQIGALMIGVVVLATGVFVGVRLAADDDSDAADPAAGYGMSHVHGLGLNPADGSLIVATHNGTFRIPADSEDAERLGDSLQDTMGFTVVGPDHFLGSGHPDLAGRRTGQPERLGLIESTDGGATWNSISLSGQVDFHGLAKAGDQLYGWDSGTGRFMVSSNRTDWETRSTLDLYGFVVDPADADHVVATGPDGQIESRDGGATWAAADGPPLVAVSWDRTTGLWGVDGAGVIHRQNASGWTSTGELGGGTHALLATSGMLYSAAFGDDDGMAGIYRSIDRGATWELLAQDAAN